MNTFLGLTLQDWANVATMVAAATTIIALIFVWRQVKIQNVQREIQIKELEIQNQQLKEQKETQDADFFLKLFSEFRTYNDLFTTAHFWGFVA